ncbi:uncharacterized protein LOC114528424 [Dendronephthya gigantea]|uniref:uncharacterized protein LOC114528424 n=1 Tax=Dendronephthya gigantea TaxID=151771 RepID=UPI00106B8E54|nr:uncharacterized protein LOC114528424 [Dendronephthya gigantea]
MYRRRQRRDSEIVKNVCSFCGEPSNEKKYGKFFTSKLGYAVHQYCMFFSAALPQNGKDHEGFEGFLEQDVLKEIRRASRLRCNLCQKKGASAGCCDQYCKKGFHFTCGVNQNYLFQFYGQFRAFCDHHRPYQSSTSYPSKKVSCPICLESVPCCVSPDVLATPCCKDVWLHRTCVQEQATVSGYFFRCPVCNDKEKFVKEMKRMGIYVPDRDAAWEDGNNFAELLDKYSSCDSPACKCPLGRKFSAENGEWELVLCNTCGQFGTHVGCKTWTTNPPSLLCPTCRPAVHQGSELITRSALKKQSNPEGRKSITSQKGKGPLKKNHQSVDSDTDSEDISKVLNGLKRQTEDDFLSSDTSFFVQRAIAAGTAAIENNGPKTHASSSVTCNRKRKADDSESDDEIMITKYVPGQKAQNKCQVCPKCNRRKRANIPTSSPAKMPRKDFPSTGYTSISDKGSHSGSSSTKSSVEITELGYESESFVPEGKASRRANAHAREPKVADYEIIELAADHTHRSSVLLLPSEEKSGELEDKVEKDEILLSSDDGAENEAVSKPKKSGSFWLSSVERLFQFLNPRSSPEAGDEKKRTSKDKEMSEGDVEAQQQRLSSGEESETFVKKSISLDNTSATDERRSPSLGQKAEGAGGRHSGETSEAIGDNTTSFGNRSETTEEMSESHVNTLDNMEENSGSIANTSNFASSLSSSRNGKRRDFEFLMRKAVLEEVIDHAIELKNSGKELKHRCVSSC